MAGNQRFDGWLSPLLESSNLLHRALGSSMRVEVSGAREIWGRPKGRGRAKKPFQLPGIVRTDGDLNRKKSGVHHSSLCG
jgi:hypothetical protein